MENERFERLLKAARQSFHVPDDVLNLQREVGLKHYRQMLDLLELEGTPDQWTKVLESIEQNWP